MGEPTLLGCSCVRSLAAHRLTEPLLCARPWGPPRRTGPWEVFALLRETGSVVSRTSRRVARGPCCREMGLGVTGGRR